MLPKPPRPRPAPAPPAPARLAPRGARAAAPGGRRGGEAPGDAGLEALLQGIARRKARQRMRLAMGPSASPPPARRSPEPRSEAVKAREGEGPGLAVEAAEWITDDLVRLKLQRPPGLDYRPGQHVKLELEGVAHSYSLVSAPHEPFLEFFIERVPGGRFSTALAGLRAGDRIGLARGPKGDFTFEPGHPAHLMIATVTGIGPFVSMLRSFTRGGAPGHRFVVVHGASFHDELAFREELEALSAAYPEQVRFVPTVSRPEDPRNAGWSGETGRVHEVAERLAPALGLEPASTLVYACGHPGMVDAAQTAFGARGFPVKTESY